VWNALADGKDTMAKYAPQLAHALMDTVMSNYVFNEDNMTVLETQDRWAAKRDCIQRCWLCGWLALFRQCL
jgi:hypothetical protein